MNTTIEITNRCFQLIFKGTKCVASETFESRRILRYYNTGLDIKGYKIYNFTSCVYQYYLQDIND